MDKRILPTPERLHELLTYSPDTGKFIWNRCSSMSNNWNSKYAGKVALDCDNGNGYKRGEVGGVRLYTHRVAWAMTYGKWPVGEIDHINGMPSDNRIVNLREVSSSQNSMNVRRHKDGRSGYKGVCWHKQQEKWVANIWVNGKNKSLGLHKTKEEAYAAYCAAASKYFGEFSRIE